MGEKKKERENEREIERMRAIENGGGWENVSG